MGNEVPTGEGIRSRGRGQRVSARSRTRRLGGRQRVQHGYGRGLGATGRCCLNSELLFRG